MDDKLLRLPDVMKRTGLARSTVWKWVADGKLPKPIKLSPRVSVWKESEISRFIAGL
jgi:prophage regulatory protein